jgi:hypothetical protein
MTHKEDDKSIERTYWFGNRPNYEAMSAKLLDKEILICSCSLSLYCQDEKFPGIPAELNTIILMVDCSDVFVWGCQDAECVSLSDLPTLFKMYEENPKCGDVQWVCLKRNEKPQNPMVDWLKENNSWTEELENLPNNRYDEMRLSMIK